jgi:hypothetical protein
MLPTCFNTRDGATAIGQLANKAPLGLACSLTAGGKLSTESLTSLADYVTVSHGGPRPLRVSGGLVSRLSQIAQGWLPTTQPTTSGASMAPGPG